MFNPKILTAMKQKLKKIGVVAVLLAMSVFAEIGNAQRMASDASISPLLADNIYAYQIS
jgi:hypothetical protein